jgi:hypothetical protein
MVFQEGYRDDLPPGKGTSEHFLRAVGKLWPDQMREDEGVLFLFLLRYFRRHEASRSHPVEVDPTEQSVTPLEFAFIADVLLEDSRNGRDRFEGYQMPDRLRGLHPTRYEELRETVGDWALRAFGESFHQELKSVQFGANQPNGQY